LGACANFNNARRTGENSNMLLLGWITFSHVTTNNSILTVWRLTTHIWVLPHC